MKAYILLITLLFGIQINSYAQTTQKLFCKSSLLDDLPVQAQGRIKPYLTLASESIKFISNSTKFNDLNASEVFCLLSLQSIGLESSLDLEVRVDHANVKKLLQMDDRQHSIKSSIILPRYEELRNEYQTLRVNDSYKKDLNKVIIRVELLQEIIAGRLWTIPEFTENETKWSPLVTGLTQEKIQAQNQPGMTGFETFFTKLKNEYVVKHPNSTHVLEYHYKRLHLFSYSMLLCLLSIIIGVITQKDRFLVIPTLLAVGLEIVAITMRVYISGRAPITNMYETVMFSGIGALILSLIIYAQKKDRQFIYGGLGYNILCLLMMTFANDMLDSSISPLVPVLRDNFWLSTHVTTIILSYAALALSWFLANMVLIKIRLKKITTAHFNYQVQLVYTCIKYGIVMLAAGIILGGVWADYSWGRFWGWDPKETWSLIVLLIYMAILHGKYSSWINNQRFIPLVAFAFLSVMMAWFGVNYILASGLHSYGFSEGGAIFLGSFFMVQIIILLVTWPGIKSRIEKLEQAT